VCADSALKNPKPNKNAQNQKPNTEKNKKYFSLKIDKIFLS
jgi:hypothetical protein